MRNLDRIYGIWPTAEDLARDIGETGTKVRQWRNRNRTIPPRYWSRIISAGARRGATIPVSWFVPDLEAIEAADRLASVN